MAHHFFDSGPDGLSVCDLCGSYYETIGEAYKCEESHKKYTKKCPECGKEFTAPTLEDADYIIGNHLSMTCEGEKEESASRTFTRLVCPIHDHIRIEMDNKHLAPVRCSWCGEGLKEMKA